MSDATTIQTAILEHLCRKDTVVLYVFFDDPTDA